jgi:hypothetical protein
MAALRTGSAEHGIYKAVGIIVLAVFSLGFLVGLAMALTRLSRDNKRTDINCIERYGWVSHHGLVSRAALSEAGGRAGGRYVLVCPCRSCALYSAGFQLYMDYEAKVFYYGYMTILRYKPTA